MKWTPIGWAGLVTLPIGLFLIGTAAFAAHFTARNYDAVTENFVITWGDPNEWFIAECSRHPSRAPRAGDTVTITDEADHCHCDPRSGPQILDRPVSGTLLPCQAARAGTA